MSDAARLLLNAAKRLEPLNAESARETHLEALGAAMWPSDLDNRGVVEAAEAARAAPPGPDPPRSVDLLLDGFALRITEGYAAAAPLLTRALAQILALDVTTDERAAGSGLPVEESPPSVLSNSATSIPGASWRLVRFSLLVTRARSCSCSSRSTSSPLPIVVGGELTTAAQVLAEDRLIAEASGNRPLPYNQMLLAAWRGEEGEASELIEATLQAPAVGGLASTGDVRALGF